MTSEYARTLAAQSLSLGRSSKLETEAEPVIVGENLPKQSALGKIAAEFILRVMLRLYEKALLVEAQEDLNARKAIATA